MNSTFTNACNSGRNTQLPASDRRKISVFSLAELVLLACSIFFKKSGKNYLPVLVLLICAPCWLFGQTTWTGATNTDWHNAGNWSAGLPGVNDMVTIPNMANDPKISTSNAVGQNVLIASGAVLTITSTGVLTVINTKNTNPNPFLIEVVGTLTNSGTINCSYTGTGGTVTGIYNHSGTFNNLAGSTVSITNFATGILNIGTFNNAATINIGLSGNSGAIGVENESVFNNNTGGQIRIENTSSLGLRNGAGTFNNVANITIGSSNSIGDYGLKNNSDFNNTGNGQIKIDRSTLAGLLNEAGIFTNSATITVGGTESVGQSGVINMSTFNNNTGGQIKIDRCAGTGLFNDGVTFTNAASIIIGSNAGSAMIYGIHNMRAFNNNAGGQISIDRSTSVGLWNNSIGIFTNASTLNIGSSAAVGLKCIYNEFRINNNTGGVINANRSSQYGIENFTGSFNNRATINIGSLSSIGTDGLLNRGNFNNYTGGQINIDRSTLNGILNFDDASFNNAAALTIGGTASSGENGIVGYISSSFSNTGSISIERTSAHGIWNSGDFTNSSTVTIGNDAATAMVYTLLNDGASTFVNETGGDIHLNRSTDTGLLNYTSFTNKGTIHIGSTGTVGLFGLSNNGTFNNNTGAELNVNSLTSRAITNSQGTFTNAAAINIGSLSNVGYWGLINRAVFNNTGSGQIKIDRCSVVGLWNDAGTFNNAATLNIGSIGSGGAKGIFSESTFNNNAGGIIVVNNTGTYGLEHATGTFTNAARITIGSLSAVGTYGLRNSATFISKTGGQIYIDRSSEAGLWNNAGTFTNSATVNIGSTAAIGDRCIFNNASGTFNNNAGGTINANNASLYAVEHVSGAFTNAATINIGSLSSAGSYGLRNSGTFDNNTGGVIKIDRCTTFGLRNNAGTFTNAATLTIGSLAAVGTTGISNSAAINNNTGATINIDRITAQGINNTAGIFTSNGIVKIGEITSVATLFNASGGEFSNGTGGIFKGTGSIDAEFFTNAGGTLSPGYSPGIQTFSTAENFATSTLILEVAGSGGVAGTDFDRIAVTGTATLSNTTYLQLIFSYAVVNGTTFDLITATSISGTIPAGNISFTNMGAGNVTGVSVSYPGSNILRVTVTSPGALPVTLVSFVVKKESDVRQLQWETSMEQDNDYFEIQRSTDAKTFSAIAQVKSSASGMKRNHYRYTDSETILGESVYYRLKMVDLDQSFTYSRIQSVQLDQVLTVKIFPNPVSGSLIVETGDWANVDAVNIYSLNGRSVYSSVTSGLSNSVDMKPIGAGTYVVELRFKNGQTKTSRIVVTK